MIKYILLGVLTFNSFLFSKTFYYMSYEQNKKRFESEITKESYLKVKNNNQKFFLDENDNVVEVVKVYKEEYQDIDDYKKESEKIIKPQEIEIEEKNEVVQTSSNSNFDYKKHITVHRIFLFLLISIFLFKFLKKKNFFKRNIKNIVDIKTKHFEVEQKKREKKEIVQTQIIEEKNEDSNNFSYEELEAKRIEIFKDFKYDKSIATDKKKPLYQKISQLKKDIYNKKDLSILNKELRQIQENINNE